MSKLSFTVGDNKYSVYAYETDELVGFDFSRNDLLKSSTTLPKEKSDELKMLISEKIIHMAIYDINHFVQKITVEN